MFTQNNNSFIFVVSNEKLKNNNVIQPEFVHLFIIKVINVFPKHLNLIKLYTFIAINM